MKEIKNPTIVKIKIFFIRNKVPPPTHIFAAGGNAIFTPRFLFLREL